MREEINSVDKLHMEPTIEWMMNNTPSSAIFLNPNPTFYAWFADRQVVLARNLNVMQLYDIIKEFQVGYVIVDPEFQQFLPEIYGFISKNWTCPLPGFSLVFNKQYSSNIPEVLVYDVSGARKFNVEWTEDMLNSSRWDFYSGSGSYDWKVENGILNMSVTFHSPQDEGVTLQLELPTENSIYNQTLEVKFEVYGQAPQFVIEAFDSNSNRLGRILDYRQTTDWRILESLIPSGAAYVSVSISDVPDSCANGTLTVLVDWIAIRGYIFTNRTTS